VAGTGQHTHPSLRGEDEGAEGGEEVIREYTDGTGVWAFGVGGEGGDKWVTGFGFFYELFFFYHRPFLLSSGARNKIVRTTHTQYLHGWFRH
jgi:hypothetical protein